MSVDELIFCFVVDDDGYENKSPVTRSCTDYDYGFSYEFEFGLPWYGDGD